MNNMKLLNDISASDVAVVVVLYRPSHDDLNHILELTKWRAGVYVVVNDGNHEESWPSIENLHCIKNPTNFGLARALNQGIAAAVEAGSRYILLLDQDSRPLEKMLGQLVAAAAQMETAGHLLACVAPSLYDKKTNRGDGIEQAFAVGATFATSGTLLTRKGWDRVGPMWEELFIDAIDHEWCFRARSKGFEIALVENAKMEHDMGEASISIFGRVRPIHRSPVRHYFIVRNTLWLQRKRYIPIGWRLSELVKLGYRIPSYIITTKDRRKTLVNIVSAIFDGVTLSKKRQPI